MSDILKEYIVSFFDKEKTIISEGLQFHIDENIPISLNIYRPGSEEYFKLFVEARKLYLENKINLLHEIDKMYIVELQVGEWANYKGRMVPLDYPYLLDENDDLNINEATYKGKKVKLNAPGAHRLGKGRAGVYVNTGKKNKDGSPRIKHVRFGSTMSMAMGKSQKHKDRRKSFGARHKCSEKKDKTKAGYWSCRATKLFGRNISGWW